MPASSPINIQLNGKSAEVPDRLSLLDLLREKGLDPRIVMVEVNQQVVRREQLGEVTLKDGDQVELVRMIAGG